MTSLASPPQWVPRSFAFFAKGRVPRNLWTENFNYDAMNRILNGQSSGPQWGEAFTTDAWGNMTAIGSYNGKPHESLSTSANANNQLLAFGYDAAGNMTSNAPASYFYDAENRLIAAGGYSYIYDGDGQRVEKCTQGTTPGTCATGATGTLYWRGTSSDPLSETDLSGTVQNTYIFFNGQRVARRDSAQLVHFYFSDHLGTHGVVENATATACEQDIDYYPYGGVQNDYCPNVPQNYKFTGKERDTESGLDNFGARFEASSLGRFMSPDWAEDPDPIPYADLEDPQSLNLYSYVRNSTISSKDDDGHKCTQDPKSGNIKCEVDAPADAHVTTIPPFWPEAIGTGRTISATTIAVPLIVFTYLVSPNPPASGCYDSTDQPGCNVKASKTPQDAADPNGAKAPGKPGEKEGFKDPKTGPRWGKAPNGKYGWVDANGNVWVPTGQNPAVAHGGPHWDVQMARGGYQNVRPGGQLQ